MVFEYTQERRHELFTEYWSQLKHPRTWTPAQKETVRRFSKLAFEMALEANLSTADATLHLRQIATYLIPIEYKKVRQNLKGHRIFVLLDILDEEFAKLEPKGEDLI